MKVYVPLGMFMNSTLSFFKSKWIMWIASQCSIFEPFLESMPIIRTFS